MRKRILLFGLSLLLGCLLTGCAIPTVDQLYSVPRRPQSYSDMQSVFDAAMEDLDYSAPRNGENLQTIQMEDLDGDGIREYLIFARSDADKTLKILVFAQQGEHYALTDTLQCSGTSFDQVEYAQMDGQVGMELLVGTRISEQNYRSVGVFGYADGKLRLALSSSYMKYLTCDLDRDGRSEMIVLKPGITDAEYGAAAAYSIEDGVGKRTEEVQLSCPVDKVSRILTGLLTDGVPGVFISGTDAAGDVLTDVLTLNRGQLSNAALASSTGARMASYNGYSVFPADMDGDGILEMPALVKAKDPKGATNQRLIRWYALSSDGAETERFHTWYDYENDWYLRLEDSWLENLRISREDGSVSFYQENKETNTTDRIFSVYILTGQNREENAVIENRFVLHKGESVIYAARLEVASGALAITQEDLISNFRLLSQAMQSGEK